MAQQEKNPRNSLSNNITKVELYFQNDVEGSALQGSFGKKEQKCIMKLLTRINTESQKESGFKSF